MPRKSIKSDSTLSSASKTTKKSAEKTVSVKLQLPGALAETVKVKPTVAELIEDRNLGNYEVSVNGQKVDKSYTFQKNDIVRVGVPTKSAN